MLMAEGVKHIIITTDDPGKYRGVDAAGRVASCTATTSSTCRRSCATIDGVTVHIHDQQCAAEKRRDRKRGILPRPAFR